MQVTGAADPVPVGSGSFGPNHPVEGLVGSRSFGRINIQDQSDLDLFVRMHIQDPDLFVRLKIQDPDLFVRMKIRVQHCINDLNILDNCVSSFFTQNSDYKCFTDIF